MAAQHRRNLEGLRNQLAEKHKVSKQMMYWVWGFLGLYGIYDFLFSAAIETKYWLPIAAVGVVIFARQNDDAVERLSAKIVHHEGRYHRSCVEWKLLTGKRFGKEEADIEMAELGYGSEEGSDKHYLSIRLGILRKLKKLDDSTALRSG
jgi:hypothetical protein